MRRCWFLPSIGLLALVSLLLGCRSSEPPLDVRLSDLVVPTAEAPSSPPDQRTLRMAVASVNSPRATLGHYAQLVDYLAAHLDMQGELVQGKTCAEINDLVRERNVTLAMVCTNPCLEGQEDFGMEALVVPQVNGEAVYYSYLIVPQDSPATRLEDLRGKTFAFTDPLSNSGRLVIVYQLALMGQTSESFFSRYIFTYSHEHAIKAVAEGLVDGAAVDSLIYDYFAAIEPERVANTKIITRYGPFGSNPIVVHPGLDPELKTRLQDLLRKRIARELHDELAQSLTVLIRDLETIAGRVPADQSHWRERTRDTRSLALRLLEQTRRLIFDLRPTALDDLGLLPAIRRYAQRHLDPAHIQFQVNVSGRTRRLPTQIETALFRIAQEAITNVVRHARASQVRLNLTFDPHCVALTVADDHGLTE